MGRVGVWGLGMMWRPSRQCGNDEDDVGTTWGPWGQRGDHGDNMWRPRRPQTLGTTWGPSGGYGDDMEMTGMTWGRRGDHRDNMETTGTTKSLKMP